MKTALQELETALETETTDRAAAITAAIDALIDSAPGTLDTLNEIAAAINDDPANAFTDNLTSQIAAVQADVTRMKPMVMLGVQLCWSDQCPDRQMSSQNDRSDAADAD